MFSRMWSARVAAATVAATCTSGTLLLGTAVDAAPYSGGKQTRLRENEYPLLRHDHGKSKVRVLKVRREASGRHEIREFTVNTRLFSSEYEKVFTRDDNCGLVATDTQKNTVYVVAKRTKCDSPEQFGIDLASHFLKEYPILTAVEVDVQQAPWVRASTTRPQEHDHAFVKGAAEKDIATVSIGRTPCGCVGQPVVVSSLEGMTVLKTTQSGFAGYHKDQYTLLPECEERCLATELSSSWTYDNDSKASPDYNRVRSSVREKLLLGLFGPSKGGVFSASLQATIYDAGCLVIAATDEVQTISISTPNLHYLPCKALGVLGETFEDDVFIPTSEPSGTITCTVGRHRPASEQN